MRQKRVPDKNKFDLLKYEHKMLPTWRGFIYIIERAQKGIKS